ncbi:replication protein, partial [Enterococcus faecalis]
QLLRDMIEFINENKIVHLVDFTNYCLSEKSPAGWFEILTERNTLFLKEYIKSNWQKNKDE